MLKHKVTYEFTFSLETIKNDLYKILKLLSWSFVPKEK